LAQDILDVITGEAVVHKKIVTVMTFQNVQLLALVGMLTSTLAAPSNAFAHEKSTSVSETQGLASGLNDFFNGLADGGAILEHDIEWIDEVNGKPGGIRGIDEISNLMAQYHSAFPDVHLSRSTVVSPMRKDRTFLMTFHVKGTHTGDLMGMKPMHNHNHSFQSDGVMVITVGRSGKVSKIQAMNSGLLLEQIGYFNHIMVDTQELTKKVAAFWNRESDDLGMCTSDVKFIDDINLKGMAPDATLVGPQAILDMRKGYAAAFPDMKMTGIESTPLQGDSFIMTMTAQGTHKGELMGFPPTGKRINILVGIINKLVAGKIFEQRIVHSKYLLRELGLVPDHKPPASAKKPGVDTRGLASAFIAILNGLSDGKATLAKNVELIDEVNMPHEPVKGIQGVRDMIARYHNAFADLHFTLGAVVSPMRKDGTFLMTWQATGHHTGDMMGMTPLHNRKLEGDGVVVATVGKSGTLSKLQIMHAHLLLEQTGYLNHIMVDTRKLAKEWQSFWNRETDDLSMYTQDVKFTDDINLKGMVAGATVVGPKAILDIRNGYATSFPDLEFTDTDASPLQGDTFILMWTAHGTHKADLMGFPPTGKRVADFEGAIINKVVAGKISEQRIVHSKHLLRELGLVPERPKGVFAKEL